MWLPSSLPFFHFCLNASLSNFEQMGMPAVCRVATAAVKSSFFNKWAQLDSTFPDPAFPDS